MIILDAEADGGTKSDRYEGLTLRHPQAVLTRSSILPDYHTSEEQHRKALLYPKPPPSPWIDPRIWKATLYALAIYVFLTLTIIVPITVIKSRKHAAAAQDYWQLEDQNSLWNGLDYNYTPAALSSAWSMFVDVDEPCNEWATKSSNNATARFSLSPAGTITIHSNTTYAAKYLNPLNGKLSVEMNADTSENSVLIDLVMSYSSLRLFEQTTVCFTRSGSSKGLSIFIPSDLDTNDTLNFQIAVLLPQVNTTMDAFATYLPMMTQYFGDLTGTPLTFNSFNVEGAARPITCKSLQACQISIKNVAASIGGNFNATDSLTLDTIKGPIKSNITLTRHFSRGDRSTVLNIDTGDSGIETNLVLDSLLERDVSGKNYHPPFATQVKNFNGPLNLNITYRNQSVPAPLQLRVQNNLAPTKISLDASYQGTFSAQSKLDQVTVKDSGLSPRNDPTGANRSRTLAYDLLTSSQANGWAGWGVKPTPSQHVVQSNVDIYSALSPVSLTFEPT